MKLFDILGWHGKCYRQGKDETFATLRRQHIERDVGITDSAALL